MRCESEFSLRAERLGKRYRLFAHPFHRVRQWLSPRGKRRFQEVRALEDVSFAIRRGETVGIVGANGSGKSTLLQLMAGILSPSSGTLEVNGRVSALLELGSGFHPEFTGRENIRLNGLILGLHPDEIEAKLPDIIAFSEMEAFIDRPAKTYSSGMAVRLAYAVATAVNPDILIIDEALAVGDEAFQRKCFAHLQALKARGCTILLVSHAVGLIVELCDRALLLDKGDLLMDAAPKQVVGAYHRMIFAPADQRENVRRELRAGEVSADPPRVDPNIGSESRIEYIPRGARIEHPRLTDTLGQTVNVLNQGETYHYRYEVRLEKDARRVQFGMMLKTVSGFELAGAAGGDGAVSSIEYAAAGERFAVCFTFRCLLATGTYFANCGCTEEADGNRQPLHRILDALSFRVLPAATLGSTEFTGKVDLGIDCRATRCS